MNVKEQHCVVNQQDLSNSFVLYKLNVKKRHSYQHSDLGTNDKKTYVSKC